MPNACVKDAALLRSDGERRPGRISGLLLALTLDTPSVDTTKRIAEVHHPARRWKLVSEATSLGVVTGRSAAQTAEIYSAFLNEKLNDICESTDGAPVPEIHVFYVHL